MCDMNQYIKVLKYYLNNFKKLEEQEKRIIRNFLAFVEIPRFDYER